MAMKKICLFLLLGLCGFSKAQYRKMLDTSHFWQQKYMLNKPGQQVNCDYLLTIKNHSVVNGITYKVVDTYYSKTDNLMYGCGDHGLVREDTILKRVIILTSSGEQILYNFNKSPGDTALLYKAYQPPSVTGIYTLQSRDSVLLSDGYHRRFLYYNKPPDIEGVGNSRGLLTPFTIFEVYISMTCMSDKAPSQVIYGSSCFPLTVSVAELSSGIRANLFPNPAEELLNVQMESNSPKRVLIKNTLGQTLIDLPPSSSENITVDLKSLTKGFYFICTEVEGRTVTQRFVKN